MDGLGLVVRIPDCQSHLRQGRFEYMRRIDFAIPDNHCLAILIGAVDTGRVREIIGILQEGNYSHLLRTLSENAEMVLGHHSLRYFREIKRSLFEAATAIKPLCYQPTFPILFENADSKEAQGAAFQITQLSNFWVNLYPKTLQLSGNAQLCCGCPYNRDIYTKGFANFQHPCLHHDPQTLRTALWEVKEVPCETELEKRIMRGGKLQQCAKCSLQSFSFIVEGACLKGCNLCFDCVAQGFGGNVVPYCVACNTVLHCDRVFANKQTCRVGSRLLSVSDQALMCSCGAPRRFPLFYCSNSKHQCCAICPNCQLQNSTQCSYCQQPTGDEEGMIISVAQGSSVCWLCFSNHECRDRCQLCHLNELYISQFPNQMCMACGQLPNVVKCPICSWYNKAERMVTQEDTVMCQSCAYSKQAQAVDYGSGSTQYVYEEEKREESKSSSQWPAWEAALIDQGQPPLNQPQPAPQGGTPQDPGCISCKEDYRDSQEYHECPSGRWCLWCFSKKIITRKDIDKCPGCEKHIIEVIPFSAKLEIYCENCNTPRQLNDFLHRSRCSVHKVCKACVIGNLAKSNGYYSCELCPKFQTLPCASCLTPGCKNLASRAVHSGELSHPLCWTCALEKFSGDAEMCSCGGQLYETFRETLRIKAGMECSVCHSVRPLIPFSCGCKVNVCALCVDITKDLKVCPNCKRELIASEEWVKCMEWVKRQREKCVGCLREKHPDIMLDCGHYYHTDCIRRAGTCELCARLNIKRIPIG